MIKKSKTAEVIISALPYIRKFRDKILSLGLERTNLAP